MSSLLFCETWHHNLWLMARAVGVCLRPWAQIDLFRRGLDVFAWRAPALTSGNLPLVPVAILGAVAAGAAALHIQVRGGGARSRCVAVLLMAAAIFTLPFVGMAALRVGPLGAAPDVAEKTGSAALALAVLAMSGVAIGSAFVSFQLDRRLRAEAETRLRELSQHDPLTGLRNRTPMRARVADVLDEARREGGQAALIALDFDDFRNVNEELGQAAGDAILKGFAERLRRGLGDHEFAARLGGDEFAVARGRCDPAALQSLLGRIDASVRGPPARKPAPRVSIGVALYPQDGRDVETLASHAESALKRAKAERSGRPCFYAPGKDEGGRRRRRLAAELGETIAQGGLELHYQRQARTADGATTGYEALARWPRNGEYVPPADFIPLAEENGLIDALGDWALRRACAQAAGWASEARVAVNVSPLQLETPGLAARVAAALAEAHLPPRRLELELTESAVVRDCAASLATIRAIRAQGVAIALDDFGVGHSSLAILRKFPFDKIKLDGAFLREIETDKQAKAILRAVLALGRSLDVPVLAEGVETEGQLQMLRDEGCGLAQGYWLGRPEPEARLLASGELRRRGKACAA